VALQGRHRRETANKEKNIRQNLTTTNTEGKKQNKGQQTPVLWLTCPTYSPSFRHKFPL